MLWDVLQQRDWNHSRKAPGVSLQQMDDERDSFGWLGIDYYKMWNECNLKRLLILFNFKLIIVWLCAAFSPSTGLLRSSRILSMSPLQESLRPTTSWQDHPRVWASRLLLPASNAPAPRLLVVSALDPWLSPSFRPWELLFKSCEATEMAASWLSLPALLTVSSVSCECFGYDEESLSHERSNKAPNPISCNVNEIGCMQGVIDYINKYAFCQVAIYGKAYIPAARDTWTILKDRGIVQIINDNLIGNVWAMGAIMSGVFSGLASYLYLRFSNPPFNSNGEFTYVIVVMAFVMGLQMLFTVGTVIDSGVATTFVCLAEDPAALARTKPGKKKRAWWLLLFCRCCLLRIDRKKKREQLQLSKGWLIFHFFHHSPALFLYSITIDLFFIIDVSRICCHIRVVWAHPCDMACRCSGKITKKPRDEKSKMKWRRGERKGLTISPMTYKQTNKTDTRHERNCSPKPFFIPFLCFIITIMIIQGVN